MREHNDTNVGPGMYYDTPEEKEIGRLEKQLADLRTQLAAAQRERDEAKAHDDQMNVALGKLAPKGTWICEVLENIWRAENVETASFIASANSLQIERQGFWTGPRLEEQLTELRTQSIASRESANCDQFRAEVARLTKERELMLLRCGTGGIIEELQAQLTELQRDRERLNALDLLCEGYGCSGEHEGNRWVIDGSFADIRGAADDLIKRAAMRAKGEA